MMLFADSDHTQKMDGMNRIRWTTSIGITHRHASESARDIVLAVTIHGGTALNPRETRM
jgi:hypothetical protein